jgi:Cytochrome c554 and c-prime
MRIIGIGVLLGALASWAGGVAAGTATAVEASDARAGTRASYSGSQACAGCHPSRFATWKATFHRTMTQDVSAQHPEVVLGAFNGARYRYAGVTAEMNRDGEGRFVMTFTSAPQGSAAGRVVRAVVVRAVGSHRYQQYLAEFGGALWRLPMAYHIEERRWFHMNGAFFTPDADADFDATAVAPVADLRIPVFGGGAFDRHVTRWNDNCIFCHNVAPNPGRDPTTGAFNTSVAELGVACEACHGPGGQHVRQRRRAADPSPGTAHGSAPLESAMTNPARLSPSRSADICGRCHGQRLTDDVAPFLARGDPFVPGENLELYSTPLWRDTPLRGDAQAFAARFWNDGTPRLTAYEFQGWLQSRCAQRGVLTCNSCHEMHGSNPRGQLRDTAGGDLACTSTCHTRLSTARAKAVHARHDAGGAGARCVACHMPRVVYGVMDVHVSHRIEIPDPAKATATGRPDACTLCHVERGRQWASAAVARLWHSRTSPPDARRDDGLAPLEGLFAADPIGRAVAAEALGTAPEIPGETERSPRGRAVRQAALLAAMASERYPAVRHLAGRALARLLATQDRAAESIVAAAYDATAPAPQRAAQIAILERALPEAARLRTSQAARVADLRARSLARDIDIGE